MTTDSLDRSPATARERRRLQRPGQEALFVEPEVAAGSDSAPCRLELRLWVDDPEVLEALLAVPESEPRQRFAATALRLGVLALRHARGELDAKTMRREGDKIMGEIATVLRDHATRFETELATALREYLDPHGGKFAQRIEKLVAHDGELSAILRTHVAGEGSEIAKTLAAHVGQSSPLFKMLDPGQADGLIHTLQDVLEQELDGQRERVLSQFSLDDDQSALSRLVRQITDENGRLKKEFAENVDRLKAQFSLDDDQSALSRLVGRVERAHCTIVEQFSLDHETSALSRLRKEVTSSVDKLQREQQVFQERVIAVLSEMSGRRQEEERGTRQGLRFEDQASDLLRIEAQRSGDLFEACGASTGIIRNCKKGDQVVELGPESPSPGAKIVFECKDDRSYDDRRALDELDEARRNRGADVGVFVFSARIAGEREPFRRVGRDLLIVWAPTRPESDVFLRAAVSVARAMIFEKSAAKTRVSADFHQLERAIADIVKQADRLDTIRKSGETIQHGAAKILNEVARIRQSLQQRTEELEAHVAAIRDAL